MICVPLIMHRSLFTGIVLDSKNQERDVQLYLKAVDTIGNTPIEYLHNSSLGNE